MEKSRSTQNSGTEVPDPEVSAIPKRRTFTADHKLEILKQVDACKDRPGAVGELLRRQGLGLYSSHLTEWRKERDREAHQKETKEWAQVAPAWDSERW